MIVAVTVTAGGHASNVKTFKSSGDWRIDTAVADVAAHSTYKPRNLQLQSGIRRTVSLPRGFRHPKAGPGVGFLSSHRVGNGALAVDGKAPGGNPRSHPNTGSEASDRLRCGTRPGSLAWLFAIGFRSDLHGCSSLALRPNLIVSPRVAAVGALSRRTRTCPPLAVGFSCSDLQSPC